MHWLKFPLRSMADNLQVSTYELFSIAMYIWNVYSHNAVPGIRTCNLWSFYISVKPNNKDNLHNMIQNTDLEQKWERSKKKYYQFLSNKKKMVPGEKPNVHNKVQMGMSLTTKKESLFRFYELKVIQSSWCSIQTTDPLTAWTEKWHVSHLGSRSLQSTRCGQWQPKIKQKLTEHNNCRHREQNLNMRKTNMEITGDMGHSKTWKHFAQQISSDPQEEKKLECSRLSTARYEKLALQLNITAIKWNDQLPNKRF